MEQPTNEERARRAEIALAAYAGDDNDDECRIVDLIADLLHRAHTRRLEIDDIVCTAIDHYEAERANEQEETLCVATPRTDEGADATRDRTLKEIEWRYVKPCARGQIGCLGFDALEAAFDAGRRAAQWDAIEACRALHDYVNNRYDDVPAELLAVADQARRAIGEPVSLPDDRETDDPT